DRGQGKEKEPIETCTPSQEDEVEADHTETKSFESTPNVITILDDEATTIHDDAPDDFNASEDTPDGFNTSVLPERSQFLPFKLDCSAIIDKSNKIHRGNNKMESASKSQSNKVTNKRRIISTNLPERKHQKCQDSH
ncbi:hypothetical protein RhiirA1_487465, partial [Rhizophagus irregularis]